MESLLLCCRSPARRSRHNYFIIGRSNDRAGLNQLTPIVIDEFKFWDRRFMEAEVKEKGKLWGRHFIEKEVDGQILYGG